VALARWIKAVLKRWVAGVTGGLLVGALALYSELTGQSVSPRAYEAVVVLVLFQAMFLAWKREEDDRIKAENRVAELETKNPQLAGEVLPGSRWSPWVLQRDGQPETWTSFICNLGIRNLGSVPSTVRDFRLRVPMSNTLNISMGMDPEVAELARLNGGKLPEDKIPMSQHIEPIMPGGEWRGRITFSITISPDNIHGLPVEILFRDVRGFEHVVPWRFP
jgi:hypothetical protein